MPFEDIDEAVVCVRAHRLVRVGPDGERAVFCPRWCPLGACATRVDAPEDDDALGEAATVARRLGLHGCGELMTPLVTALDTELPVREALAVLEVAKVTTAPVVDDNMVLVGTVSSCELHASAGEADVEVEDAMTPAVAVSSRLSVPDIARVMDEHDLDRVPVVDADGRLVGLVAAIDVVRWFRRYALSRR